jgi:hypothetical protein
VLTELQMRNGITNTARRWRNKIVPFVIDDVFGEYYSTKIKRGLRLSQDGRQMETSYATELQRAGPYKRDTVSCEFVHWVDVVHDRA